MMIVNQRQTWLSLGLSVLALLVGGCPSAGTGTDPNTNGNTSNDNNNDNGTNDNSDNNGNDNGDGGGDVEAGVDIAIPNEGQNHVPVGVQVTYQANPPASGPHWSAAGVAPVEAGVYESALEEEQWVHNLEHGYVVLLYDCHGPCLPDLLEDLQSLFDAAPPSEVFGNTKLVITPYDGLPFAFTVVAWDWQLHLEALDQEAVLDFYSRFVDQGPESVP